MRNITYMLLCMAGSAVATGIVLSQQDAEAVPETPAPPQKSEADNRTIDQRIAADDTGEVFIEVPFGEIKVEGWDKDEVYVTGQLSKRAKSFKLMKEGSKVIAKVEWKTNRHHRRHHRDLQDPEARRKFKEKLKKKMQEAKQRLKRKMKTVRDEKTGKQVIIIKGDDQDDQLTINLGGEINVDIEAALEEAEKQIENIKIERSEAASEMDEHNFHFDFGDSQIHIDIDGEYDEDDDVETELVFRVPENSRLKVKSVSGDTEIRKVLGAVKVKSISGDVSITDASGDRKVEAVSGDVTLRGPKIDADVEVVSGSVTIKAEDASVEVGTVSGEARIEAEKLRRLESKTVGGEVRVTGRIDEDATCEIKAHSGEINLDLPSNAPGTFEIKTFSGEVDSDLPVIETRKKRMGHHMVIGHGGNPRCTVKSFSGEIQID